MAEEKVTVDCGTGQVARGPLSLGEQDQRREDARLHTERMNDRDTEEAKRETVLDKLARAAGVDLDDVKLALGAGQRQADRDGKRPQRGPARP